MTNFQDNPSAGPFNWITPERALQTLPVVVGTAIAVLLTILAIRPIWESNRIRHDNVNTLLVKANALPTLKNNLVNQIREYDLLRQQEFRLLSLLAGPQDLGTFLSELDTLAERNDVKIISAEPGEIEIYSPPVEQVTDSTNSQSMSTSQSPTFENNLPTTMNQDPLLRESFEKRSAALTVQGLFPDVLSFLQDLESLQVFVITSNLNLVSQSAASVDKNANQRNNNFVQTKLDLKLTVYGLAQKYGFKNVLKEQDDLLSQL